ncbi:hypothetical protein IWQ60_000200 [Tieghemiomyces parasiticus]|uniref:Branched-chain-amino-acid aminotransferase n=1 Tax=Tieghemiomyces parasiticus TaxID=78921 RepID=A0A9W8AMQ4_9FUNG|nr:hypothetical protein IWQ60_000200 [Tieghemiomyces parasiticus]
MPSLPLPPDFALLESIRLRPTGELDHLDRHLDRLNRSSRTFADLYGGAHFAAGPSPAALRRRVEDFAQRVRSEASNAVSTENDSEWKIRLLVDNAGEITLEADPLAGPRATNAVRPKLFLHDEPVDSADLFLRHKTTRRAVYAHAWRAHGLPRADSFDVLLTNERGEVTEGCISNVAVETRDSTGRTIWLTPALNAGLLDGCLRAARIEDGTLTPATLRPADLLAAAEPTRSAPPAFYPVPKAGRRIVCFNSVRGEVDVELVVPN